MLPAKPKIEAYIAYRREREDEFMDIMRVEREIDYGEMFERVYHGRGIDKDSMLREMA